MTASERIREARLAQERARALVDPDCQSCYELGRACRVHALRPDDPVVRQLAADYENATTPEKAYRMRLLRDAQGLS